MVKAVFKNGGKRVVIIRRTFQEVMEYIRTKCPSGKLGEILK